MIIYILLPPHRVTGKGSYLRLCCCGTRRRDNTGQRELLFVDWKVYEHPQLGKVEIGGFMETMHMNPMMETMGPIMEGCHASIVHHAKQHPLVSVVRTQPRA